MEIREYRELVNSAHMKLSRAIVAGKLLRQPCEVCGDIKSQGHHDDYREPLSVRWLCLKHHRNVHKGKIRHQWLGTGASVLI